MRQSSGRQPSAVSGAAQDKLVLSSQFRVADQDVLRLRPEDAVETPHVWQKYQEPPLRLTQGMARSVPRKATQASSIGTNARPPQRSDISELTAKIAALETAIAKTVDQWEPDDAGQDAYAGTVSSGMAWQKSSEPDDIPRGMSSQRTKTRNAFDAHRSEHGLQNQALRELVTKAIREELRGALGDRITRNVRKLVRREILRALMERPAK